MRDKILLRKRSLIETINDQPKNICGVEHSRHRSFGDFITNLVASLIAYSFQEKSQPLSLKKMLTQMGNSDYFANSLGQTQVTK